jgi:hypothetical protein
VSGKKNIPINDKKKNTVHIVSPIVKLYLDAMIPSTNGAIADKPLPKLKQNPAPVARTKTGNISGKYDPNIVVNDTKKAYKGPSKKSISGSVADK